MSLEQPANTTPSTPDAIRSSYHSLDQIIGQSLPVTPEKPYQVLTRAVKLGRGIVKEVGAMAAAHLPPGHVLLLADTHTFPIAGQQVRRALTHAGFAVTVLELEDGHDGKVEADDAALSVVEEALDRLPEPRAGVIALGAGTINDLAKLPAFRKGLAYGVVPTAASMNGYTSAIAAILSGGVKRTISCAPPRFVLCDLELVASAPLELARSGLGDLMSKPVSSGDWRLSHHLLGEAFYALPVSMVESAFRRTQAVAEGIGKGDPEALGPLMEALLISGVSMASAGSSAPASGGEHLLSHLWDMTANFRGRAVGLHGAQVGVATLVTATLYQHLGRIKPSHADIDAALERLLPFDAYAERLSSLPAELRPAVEVESRKKYPSPELLRARLTQVVDGWDALWQDLSSWVQTPDVLRQVLTAAGAPTSAKMLGIPELELREAYRIARDIRSRYSILDLAWELGRLDDLEQTVLQESGVLE